LRTRKNDFSIGKLACQRYKLLVSRKAGLRQLTLSNQVRCFDTGQGRLGRMERFEAHHGPGNFLNKPVILFNATPSILGCLDTAIIKIFILKNVNQICPTRRNNSRLMFSKPARLDPLLSITTLVGRWRPFHRGVQTA
jgi:hypothetical protein